MKLHIKAFVSTHECVLGLHPMLAKPEVLQEGYVNVGVQDDVDNYLKSIVSSVRERERSFSSIFTGVITKTKVKLCVL